MEISFEKRQRMAATFKQILDDGLGPHWADQGLVSSGDFADITEALIRRGIIFSLIEATEEIFGE